MIAEFARRRAPLGSASGTEDLTPKEREVLAALAEGLSNAEIARCLVIEIGTVKTHVSRVIFKLGVRDRVGAIIWAYQHKHNQMKFERNDQ